MRFLYMSRLNCYMRNPYIYQIHQYCLGILSEKAPTIGFSLNDAPHVRFYLGVTLFFYLDQNTLIFLLNNLNIYVIQKISDFDN